MIICLDCKHGGRHEHCQSPHCVSLSAEQKKAVYASCAFFEPAEREELRDEEMRREEPGLFDA